MRCDQTARAPVEFVRAPDARDRSRFRVRRKRRCFFVPTIAQQLARRAASFRTLAARPNRSWSGCPDRDVQADARKHPGFPVARRSRILRRRGAWEAGLTGPHAATAAELKERLAAERRGHPFLIMRGEDASQILVDLPEDGPPTRTIGRAAECDIAHAVGRAGLARARGARVGRPRLGDRRRRPVPQRYVRQRPAHRRAPPSARRGHAALRRDGDGLPPSVRRGRARLGDRVRRGPPGPDEPVGFAARGAARAVPADGGRRGPRAPGDQPGDRGRAVPVARRDQGAPAGAVREVRRGRPGAEREAPAARGARAGLGRRARRASCASGRSSSARRRAEAAVAVLERLTEEGVRQWLGCLPLRSHRVRGAPPTLLHFAG